MVDFLNDDVTFEGEVAANSELIANGGLVVGPGGLHYGESPAGLTDTWRAHTRIQVANVTERNALVAWRVANAPISSVAPLLVWRADGSSTGLNEMTVDGTNWYAESPMAGDIEMTLAETAPYGWALMQGQTLTGAQSAYPALWATASAALRSGSNLVIPDMRGRVPMGMGQGSGLTMRNLGNLLGDELVTLSVANLPAHNHTGTTGGTNRSLNHDHWFRMSHDEGSAAAGSGSEFEKHNESSGGIHRTSMVSQTADPAAGAGLNHTHAFTTANTGSGTGHPNVQPSTVVNFKVKL